MRRNRQQKPAEGTSDLGEPSGVCFQGLPLRVSPLDIDALPLTGLYCVPSAGNHLLPAVQVAGWLPPTACRGRPAL